MAERRAIQVLEEWRELERQLATGKITDSERARLVRRVADLRAEYHALARRRGSFDELLHPPPGSRDDAPDPLTPRESAGSAG